MTTVPSLETIKSWPELAPGLHWTVRDGANKSESIVPARSQLKVHYRAHIVQADQTLQQIESTIDGDFSTITDSNESFSFVLGSNSTLESWEQIFCPTETHKGICVGQVVEFLAPAHLCYGASGRYASTLSDEF